MKIFKCHYIGIMRAMALIFVFIVGLSSILGTTGSSGKSRPRGATACAGPDQHVRTGDLVKLDARCSELRDAANDDDYLGYRWLIESKPAGSRIELPDNRIPNPRFIADVDGLYVLKLVVRAAGNNNVRDDEIELSIRATTDNAIPVAHPGSVMHVKIGDNPVLDGSRSSDADGDLITYLWDLREPIGDGVTLNDADTATPSFDTPVSNVYRFGLVVNDGAESSERKIVNVRVTRNDQNACPDAAVGPDQRVTTGTLVNLDGSASRDADGDSMTLNWRMVWRPEGSNATLDDPTDNARPSFIPDVDGAYIIKLVADDQATFTGLQANCEDSLFDIHDTVMVIASSGNSGPVADAGNNKIVDPGDTVGLNATGSSDADGDTLSYLWRFVSMPETSAATLSNAIDAEPTFVADVEGSYVVKLTVSDGFESDSDNLVVNATTGVIGPTQPVADAGPDQTVTQGATVVLDGSDSSDPNFDPLTFRWDFLDWPGAPAGSPPALVDEFTDSPEFVAADIGVYVLRLIVNDGAEDSVADTVTITAQAVGACPNPLNLVTALPFQPGLGEVATIIQIAGNDDLSVVAADMPLDINALQANIPDMNNPDQANFIALGPTWEMTSRTHANPVSDSDSPAFVVRQTTDNVYYKLDVDFTGDPGLLEVQVDALSGCRCGNNPADCPP